MKLIVLSDNRTINPNFETEHGLCVYLETENYKCLLDTGASDVFIRNAAKMNVDLTDVDYVFISHGHADHIGGLPAFLEINSKAKIIVSPNALNQKFYSQRLGLHQISIELDIEPIKNRLILVDNDVHFENDIHVYRSGSTKFAMPAGNRTLFKDNGNGLEIDTFDHELIVTFGSENLVVFTGCGHTGLQNILETIKSKTMHRIRYVMGGFHLLDAKIGAVYESEAEIENLAKTLNKNYPQTEFITGHCTGEHTFDIMKKTLEFKLIHFFTGYKLEF
jgi:7,8-dihydropterin-6-yl-methyl-4-(beta-D-ribofuranosyl)aminobenzene 5'-phosphate synthase